MNDTSFYTFQYDVARTGDYVVEDERIAIEDTEESEARYAALAILNAAYPNCSVVNMQLVEVTE